MKLSSSTVSELRRALRAAKVLDIDVLVFTKNKVLGANTACDAAVISDCELGLSSGDNDTPIGIGSSRVAELLKRLTIFGEDAEAELKISERGNQVSQITISSGRSKIQFRCTSMSLLERKYPTQNADTPFAVITMSREEITQLNTAAKTLGAETVTVRVGRAGEVQLQCADSNNDQYAVTLATAGEFVGEAEPVAFIYRASAFSALINESCKDDKETTVVLGEGGSLSADVYGHTLLITNRTEED